MKTGLQQQLEELKREEPTAYAVLEKHIDAIKKGIERSPDNFPNSGKILEYAEAEEEFYTQHVGRSLSILNDFGIVGIYRKRSNSVRYDLTNYDADRLETIHELLR